MREKSKEMEQMKNESKFHLNPDQKSINKFDRCQIREDHRNELKAKTSKWNE
jgi:hypothetical protein